MLTDNDVKRIADAIEAHRPLHRDCPMGLTPDAVEMVNGLAGAWKIGRKAAITAFATMVVTAALGALWLGIKHSLKL